MIWIGLPGWKSWLLGALCIGLLAVLIRWYVIESRRLYRRFRAGAELREHRTKLQAGRQFHPSLLTPTEQRRVLNEAGLTAEQWCRGAASDYFAGRRDHMPSCAEWSSEFGSALRKHHRTLQQRRFSTH